MRPQQNANVQAEDKSPVSRTRSARTEPIEGTDSVEDASEEWDERNQKEIEAVKSRCETRLGEIVAQLKAAQKETVETFTDLPLARAEVLRQQTLTHREHAERLEDALLAMQRQEQAAATASTDRASAALAAPEQGSGAAAGPSGDENLQALEEEQDGSAGSAIEEVTQMSPDGIQPNTRRTELHTSRRSSGTGQEGHPAADIDFTEGAV
ncbi:unnamed protein product [Prorocentrum cordatum]|uniref:Uncharacterized protein n=1 Tax=Prorocentrum cordatum TaxID=2364126 RepID=A0ABN9UR30_9DINO|nr:unnamed protein product [Polarella glacialis]